jgi:hypothetical protein
MAIVLASEVELTRTSRRRGATEVVHADGVLVAVTRRDDVLRAAARRRVRVEAV